MAHFRFARLNLVDLAGSERQVTTSDLHIFLPRPLSLISYFFYPIPL